MAIFMVGYADFFNNDLIVECIEAENWKSALARHSKMMDEEGNPDDNSWLPDDMKEAKMSAFDADFLFDVKEIVGV